MLYIASQSSNLAMKEDAMSKPKQKILWLPITIPNGPAGMENVLGHLERAIEELNEAAFFFEQLGMDSQRGKIDEALDRVEDVAGVLEVLLGRIALVV
jgi:hypothetical protein